MFFRKKKQEEEFQKGYWFRVNLNSGRVKVDVPANGERLLLENVLIDGDEKLIWATHRGDKVFDVTPRSTAFGELEPWMGQKTRWIRLWRAESEFGEYIAVGLKFDID